MKKLLILLTGLVFPGLLFSQSRIMTMEEATLGTGLSVKNLQQLQWNGESDSWFWSSGNCLLKGNVKDEKTDTVLKMRTLNFKMKEAGEDSLSRLPALVSVKTDLLQFVFKNMVFHYNLADGSLKKLNSWPADVQNTDLADGSGNCAYTRGNSLYVSIGGREIMVGISPGPGILYGSERVHRNEFGISKGTFWSPAGDRLAYYYMNETEVATYPLVDITDPIALAAPVKYPMAGQRSHYVKLFVWSAAEQKVVELETGADSTSYLTNISWSPNGRLIYVAVLNRGQDSLRLNAYDAISGHFKGTLFSETDPKYVEPEHGPFFLNGDPSRFIWLSRKDGFNHAYLYESSGKLLKQLTSGNWEVSSVICCDPAGRTVFFSCNKGNPIGRTLCSVDLKSGEIKECAAAGGTHNVKPSKDCRYFLDSWNSPNVPRKIQLLGKDGKVLRELLNAPDPMKDIKLGQMKIFTIPNKQGQDLYCRLIKPADFDSLKSYPVIIYVYGGPHSQLITDSWLGGAGLFLNSLAERGYAVFTLDNRGTSGRGKDFEQAIFRNLGTAEVEDQMCGVKYLKSLHWVDSTRIGINGWSYGGFMTISMMLRNPGVFKVGVCGGPVTEWKYYEVMYGERYMDTPQTNPDGYKQASLLNRVKDLSGKLLIIHDYQDETVVPQNSLMFIKKCVDEGKQLDYFIYPGHEHNVRGKDRIHLNEKMFRYFRDNL
jgi:dipeptidyl-peptidase-4